MKLSKSVAAVPLTSDPETGRVEKTTFRSSGLSALPFIKGMKEDYVCCSFKVPPFTIFLGSQWGISVAAGRKEEGRLKQSRAPSSKDHIF